MAAPKDAFALLEARHVDNLTESVRMLSRHVTNLIELGKKQLAATKEATSAAKAQTEAVADLAKLLKDARDDSAAQVTPGGKSRKG